MSRNGSHHEPVSATQRQAAEAPVADDACELTDTGADSVAKDADTTATSYHTTVASMTSFNVSQEASFGAGASASRLDCSAEELVFSDDNMAEDNLDIHADMSDEELGSSKGRPNAKESQSNAAGDAPAKVIAPAARPEEKPQRPQRPKKRAHAWGLKRSGGKLTQAITSRTLDAMLPDQKPDVASVLRERPKAGRGGGGSSGAEDNDMEEGEVKEAERKEKPQAEAKEPSPSPQRPAAADADAKEEPVAKEASPEQARVLRVTKVVDYQVDEPIREGPPREAKYAESPILRVVGLVRPFTPNQLKDLLSRFGALQQQQEGFWLDRIKTRCYATFESAEEAKKAREQLDNCKWPRLNPKALTADFATHEELQWALQHGNSGQPMPRHVAAAGRLKEPSPESPERKRRHDDADDAGKEAANHQRRRSSRTPSGSPRDAGNHKAARKSPAPAKSKTTEERQQQQQEGRDGRQSPAPKPEPGKLLDQLFRKTAATPYIYWMPLTDQQAAARAEAQQRAASSGRRRRSVSRSPRRSGDQQQQQQRRYTRLDGGAGRDRRRR